MKIHLCQTLHYPVEGRRDIPEVPFYSVPRNVMEEAIAKNREPDPLLDREIYQRLGMSIKFLQRA